MLHHDKVTEARDWDKVDNKENIVNHDHSASDNSHTPPHHVEDLERIQTIERVGTNAQYYEKDGLRTEGDGLDHDGSHHKMTPKLFLALTAMSFLWIGSQIPLYLFGGVTPDIYADVGGYDRWVWLVLGYLIPVAAICPFVGFISDLFGRKYVAIAGQLLLIVGPVVTSTAKTMNVAIAGQVISGSGAGLNELIALAGTGEMVPTAKRGAYVGAVVFTILPFVPSVLYAQLITKASNWRWVGAFVAAWNLLGLILVAIAYKEPPRNNSKGYTRAEILKRIDYIGGMLSIGGVLLFLMGMQWSTQQYKWNSVHVLVPFILGIIMIIAFFVYEVYGARYPMVPPRIFRKAKWNMINILLITFLSGANFFAMLLFWPTEVYNVYGDDRVGIGLRTLPVGFGILAGAVISLLLIPITKGRITLIMIFFTALMTAGTGAVCVARPDNINKMYGIVFIACFGVGGVIIPASIIAQIMCPDDLIATITAITLSIRYVGGAIGFTIYYNVFFNKVETLMRTEVATKVVVLKLGYTQGLGQGSLAYITNLVTAIAQAEYALFERLCREALKDPSIAMKGYTYEYFHGTIVAAAQEAFASAYRWPYWISIAFGGICVISACFLRNIKAMLDEHIAVPVK